jgi:regulator of nonsense transcripts 1
MDKPFDIDQTLFKAPCPTIRVLPCHESSLTIAIVNRFLDSVTTGYVGVAPAYGANCRLVRVAFATMSDVLLVHLSSKASRTKHKNHQQTRISGRELLISKIFCDPDIWKCVFKMDKLAASLFLDLHSRVTSGVDLLSISTNASRHAIQTVLTVLGGETVLHKWNVVELFEHHENAAASPESLALQAWAAFRAGTQQSTYQRLKDIRDVTTLDRPTTVCIMSSHTNWGPLIIVIAYCFPFQDRSRRKPS